MTPPQREMTEPGFIVRIETPEAGGSSGLTGFLLSSEYVLTCAHVAAAERQGPLSAEDIGRLPPIRVRVYLDDGSQVGGTAAGYAPPDCALVRLDHPVQRQPVRLFANLRAEHWPELVRCNPCTYGFPESAGNELKHAPVGPRVNSLDGSDPFDFQTAGGLPKGMSGGPALVNRSGEYFCIGMAYLGGAGTATSRFAASHTLLDFAKRNGVDYLPPADADRYLGIPKPSISEFRQALSIRGDWRTIRPILASGPEISVEHVYAELFLRQPSDSARIFAKGPETAVEQETAGTAAAAHFLTAESLVARTTGRTVIVGPPGSGKTTLLKWICGYLLREQVGNEITPVPVSLRDFADALHQRRTDGLAGYAVRTILGNGADQTKISSMAGEFNQRPVLYLLDGWDEVPTRMRAGLLREIDSAARDVPVIITSRVHAAGVLVGYSQDWYQLGPLADGAIAELCTRYGAQRGRGHLVPKLLELIETNPSLWQLAGNPYLLTLFCEVCFNAPRLPDAAGVSPAWVLSHAIELIRLDYNFSRQGNPLTEKDLQGIEQLAHHLSFGRRNKRTTFEPDAELGESYETFVESPQGRSRYFNATGIPSTSFSFVHLRMQEYLAGRWAAQNGAAGTVAWLKRHLLSHTWREEARFAVASVLCSEAPPPRGFRSALRKMASEPDECGESVRCLSAMLAAGGIGDGGKRALGIDVREILWQRFEADPSFLSENAEALLELDPAYLLDRLLDQAKPDDMRFERLYRFLPFGIRRKELDPRLTKSAMLSWMIGLPGRGFPSQESLNALGDAAADEKADLQERIHAIRDLGSLRGHSQVDRLTPLLHARNEELAIATAETLGKIGGRVAATALAASLISVKESDARESPGLIAALLNALAVHAYGAIEPHSRDLLVAHINAAPESCPNLEITLDALAWTPLPQPPERILDILASQGTATKSLRKAAASVLKGIADVRFLNRALRLLRTEPDKGVRKHVLDSLPFVPVNCPDTDQLWKLCRERPSGEGTYALRLMLRTIARSPQHPFARPLSDFLWKTLQTIAGTGECGLFQQQVLRGLRTIPREERFKPVLLRILNHPALAPEAIAMTAEALSVWPMTARDLRSIEKHFGRAVRLGKNGMEMASALAVTLFLHRPESAPLLLRKLIRHRKKLGGAPRDALMKAAQRTGYLIFPNHVVDPDGRVLRGSGIHR